MIREAVAISGDVALRYAEPFSDAGVRHRLALYIAQTGMKDAGYATDTRAYLYAPSIAPY